MATDLIVASYITEKAPGVDFHDSAWKRAERIWIDRNWRGDRAPQELKTDARVLWNDEEIIFGFECSYTELDIDEQFSLDQERYGLWDRDVCEAFIRSPIEPHDKHYREFEVAPTGQWCDLIIDRLQMKADWQWRSGMRTAAAISASEKVWRVVMAIPFETFGCRPESGDIWHGNLFRVSRLNRERQYLALSPTYTETPNFHVAERFLPLRFA